MGSKTSVGNLASEVMKQLDDYAKVTTEGMKKAVNGAMRWRRELPCTTRM